MSDISLSCSCGRFKAVLRNCSKSDGTRLKCYCKDCQAEAHALGATAILDEHGGSDIFQTVPSRLEITEGQEHLACLRLSPKGLIRWYASCCDTPVFNTLASPGLRFLGVMVNAVQGDVDAQLGPVYAIANTKGTSTGPDMPQDKNFAGAGFAILRRHLSALLSRNGRNPLFDDNRMPIVTPRVLSKTQRKAFTPDYSTG